MNTLGWLFIFAGILIARQVSKGRVKNIGEDLSDAFIAFASGDTDALGEVVSRKGETAEPTAADLAIYKLTAGVTEAMGTSASAIGSGIGSGLDGLESKLNSSLLLAAVTLGEKAKGYRWAATGPDYYDCSGLMWRAAQAVGYKGARFTTADISTRKGFTFVTAPTIGDIILWKAGEGGITGHMGVVSGAGKFYSARSVKSGIGEASISGYRKAQPRYLRYGG